LLNVHNVKNVVGKSCWS